MIFRRKRQYPLPKFPAEVAPTFLSQRETLSADEARGMLHGIEELVAQKDAAAKHNQFIDMKKVHALADRGRWLLESYEQYPAAHQALIVAAIRYFAHINDPLPEEALAIGLDDDVRVMNYVLEELGLEDKFIPED